MPSHSLVVRVPATTANLGPGFDCLGMALNLWNELAVGTSSHLSIEIEGEGETRLARDETNMIYKAITKLYSDQGQKVPPLSLRCKNAIPLRRGLGSSSAAIVAGLMAGNYLLDHPLKKEDLLQEAAAMEGHADNVAPALFGGCQIVFKESSRFLHSRLPVELDLAAILFIPDFEIPTDKARTVLPPLVSRQDAIYNLSRVALLSTSLITCRTRDLKWATQDRLHQPAREALFPAMGKIFQAAFSAGAPGVFLSGSGSTILAFSYGKEKPIGEAMLAAGAREGVAGKIVVTRPVASGAHLVGRKSQIPSTKS